MDLTTEILGQRIYDGEIDGEQFDTFKLGEVFFVDIFQPKKTIISRDSIPLRAFLHL